MNWKDKIVDAREEEGYVVFYSSVREVGRVKKDFADSLRDWHTFAYSIKCDTMADNLEHIVSCLRKKV